MLESVDVNEVINEDENSKKKNNLIIETKETLMEKQGRRDLLKLQVSLPNSLPKLTVTLNFS